MDHNNPCLFCNISKQDVISENDFCFAIWDGFPVSTGHALIIPKRHTLSFFDLNEDEITKMFSLVCEVKDVIQKKYNPDGYNIGINDGVSAGRTIHHLHLHLIPRYEGDIPNPRGGVRHIIPGKGFY
ncbi:MAG: HIT domain-containing protein [bacterium]|nr:HIT domain-containing protein [bacterium]